MHDRELIASFPPWNLIVLVWNLPRDVWAEDTCHRPSNWDWWGSLKATAFLRPWSSRTRPCCLGLDWPLVEACNSDFGKGCPGVEGSWPSMKAPWMTTSEWRLCKWLKQHMSCIISSCSEVTRKWRVCVASLGDRTLREAATWFQTIMSKGCIFWVQAGRLDFRLQHQWATPRQQWDDNQFFF